MSGVSNAHQPLYVVSIHDKDPRGVLSFDFGEILTSIREFVENFAWVVCSLESTGGAVRLRTPLQTLGLLNELAGSGQSIDGSIVGVNGTSLNGEALAAVSDLARFPTNEARIALLAIDSSYFEVLAKDREIIEAVRGAFRDVRVEDPIKYF
jgi:hypothetical protein